VLTDLAHHCAILLGDAHVSISTVQKSEIDEKLDQTLEALSNRYRRELLLALMAENPQDDDDRDPLNVIESPVEPEVLEVELVHKHLPKLEAMGFKFIEWDRDTGKIATGPNRAEIEPVLQLLNDYQDELPPGWV